MASSANALDAATFLPTSKVVEARILNAFGEVQDSALDLVLNTYAVGGFMTGMDCAEAVAIADKTSSSKGKTSNGWTLAGDILRSMIIPSQGAPLCEFTYKEPATSTTEDDIDPQVSEVELEGLPRETEHMQASVPLPNVLGRATFH